MGRFIPARAIRSPQRVFYGQITHCPCLWDRNKPFGQGREVLAPHGGHPQLPTLCWQAGHCGRWPSLYVSSLRHSIGVHNPAGPPPTHAGACCRHADLVRAAVPAAKMLREPPVPRLVGAGGVALAEAAEAAALASVDAADPTPRVAIMSEPGPGFVASTYATWLRRGIAVPLCLSHPDRCELGAGGGGMGPAAAAGPLPGRLPPFPSATLGHFHDCSRATLLLLARNMAGCRPLCSFPAASAAAQAAAVCAGGCTGVGSAGQRAACGTDGTPGRGGLPACPPASLPACLLVWCRG